MTSGSAIGILEIETAHYRCGIDSLTYVCAGVGHHSRTQSKFRRTRSPTFHVRWNRASLSHVGADCPDILELAGIEIT